LLDSGALPFVGFWGSGTFMISRVEGWKTSMFFSIISSSGGVGTSLKGYCWSHVCDSFRDNEPCSVVLVPPA